MGDHKSRDGSDLPTAPNGHQNQPLQPPYGAHPGYGTQGPAPQPTYVVQPPQPEGAAHAAVYQAQNVMTPPCVVYPAQISVTSIKASEKSIVDAYILWFVLGLSGAHHLYLRRPWFFIAYFFTFGLFGIGWLVDMFRIPGLVKESNAKYRDPSRVGRKQKVDAYLLWFPFGLLGFHLFYLRRPGQGLLYFFTFGLFGIGWLVDLCRIPHMVKDCNDYPDGHPDEPKSMFASYCLCVSPFGILGAHHYYLNRPYWGLLYTFTFGLMGLGWITDWFRCHVLVRRSREIQLKVRDEDLRYMDDIYILWFPFGWLGLHHFYLRRYGWGFLYFFTCGLMGVGWLIDFCRLPCMLNEYNLQLAESKNLTKSAQSRLGDENVESGNTGNRVTTNNLNQGIVFNPQQPQTMMYGSTLPYGVAVGPNVTQMPNTSLSYQPYPQQIVYMPAPQGYQPGYYPPQQQPYGGMPGNMPAPEQPPMYAPAPEHPPTYTEATT